MLRQAMKPNMVSYSALISCCAKGKKTHRAFDVWVAMLRQALKPNMAGYRAVISASEKGKETRWAFHTARRCCVKL